jgi:polar amino acid transport system substrate-binding protein
VSPWRLLAAAVVLLPGVSLAAKLRVCADVNPHPPYLMPDGSGSAGRLVSQAAREAGFELEFSAVPLARCRAEVKINLLHGFPITPYMPGTLPFMSYPMRNGALDESRATARVRIMLYRRTGTAVRLEGGRVGGLTRPVLVASGSLSMYEALEAAGARVDDQGKSLEANFAKLMAGRGDAAAGFEEEGARLMALPEYAGKIEVLPRPLLAQSYYLSVSNHFYAEHGPAVEKMWNAIGRLNQSAKPLKK